MIDEAGVELDEGGTGVELRFSVLGSHDASDADDGDFAAEVAVEGGDDVGGLGGEGSDGEASRLSGEVTTIHFGSGDSGVGGDQSIESTVEKDIREILDVLRLKVGCYLYGDRHALTRYSYETSSASGVKVNPSCSAWRRR